MRRSEPAISSRSTPPWARRRLAVYLPRECPPRSAAACACVRRATGDALRMFSQVFSPDAADADDLLGTAERSSRSTESTPRCS